MVPAHTWRSISKRLVITPGCWEWQGAQNSRGYGYVCVEYLGGGKTRSEYVHRVLYRELVGPIPDGLQIDHLCRNPRCANPDHLEPVTPLVNTRRSRGNNAKTHCPKGHAYDEANTYVDRRGCRFCRSCRRGAVQMSYRKRRAAQASA